jgi:16S rRNA (adenine1518-N6/adenine1519-N6)-dimethyltransferase
VEKDERLAAEHSRRWAEHSGVRVIGGDALDPAVLAELEAAGGDWDVVANLPYETGTAIVTALLARAGLVRRLAVMLQKEVVARLSARPGGKEWGLLAVHTQRVARVEPGFLVRPGAFRPPPRVDSQMVRLVTLAHPSVDVGDVAVFEALMQAAFGQRRKMLRNTVGAWVGARLGAEAAEAVFTRAGVEATRRPEAVDLAGLAGLSRQVCALLAHASTERSDA